jgi:hypothetical protein
MSISSADPRRVAAYLKSAGWAEKRRAANGTVWSLGGSRSLILPSPDLDPDDYDELRDRAVLRVAEIERRTAEEVRRDISLTDRDTLLIRIDAPVITHGEIPLRFGSEAFNGARELFTAAALAEHAPRARFGSFRPSDVIDVVDNATFGQTYAGSYIISIRTREAQQLSWLDDSPASLERRTIARSLIASAAAAQASTKDVTPTVEDGVSFELCSALTKLDPGGTSVCVELSSVWAIGLPRPIDAPAGPVRLGGPQLSHIREVRDYLASFAPVELEIVGGLTDVHVDLGGMSGRVKLEALVEGRVRPVHVELQGEQLERVRHLVGRASLRLVGRLEKGPRSWHLADPRLIGVDPID